MHGQYNEYNFAYTTTMSQMKAKTWRKGYGEIETREYGVTNMK